MTNGTTTTNANHGTITGATTVGDIDHFGILTVKGRSVAGDDDNNTAGCIKLGDTDAKIARFDYDPAGTTSLRIDNTKDSASAEIEFGLRTSGTRKVPMQLLGDGTVTASSSSGGLKQVARGFTTTIVQPAGKAFTSFRIDHNLGTQFIHVSVIEDSGNQEVVECAIRTGSWTQGQTGANIADCGSPAAATVTGVTSMGTQNNGTADETANDASKKRYSMVTFVAAPAVGTNYKVVVTGI